MIEEGPQSFYVLNVAEETVSNKESLEIHSQTLEHAVIRLLKFLDDSASCCGHIDAAIRLS